MNWTNWLQMYKIYAIAAGISNKADKVQCCVFLHATGTEAQKVYCKLNIDSANKDKIIPFMLSPNIIKVKQI